MNLSSTSKTHQNPGVEAWHEAMVVEIDLSFYCLLWENVMLDLSKCLLIWVKQIKLMFICSMKSKLFSSWSQFNNIFLLTFIVNIWAIHCCQRNPENNCFLLECGLPLHSNVTCRYLTKSHTQSHYCKYVSNFVFSMSLLPRRRRRTYLRQVFFHRLCSSPDPLFMSDDTEE